jgi:uncharacterized membrane protein
MILWLFILQFSVLTSGFIVQHRLKSTINLQNKPVLSKRKIQMSTFTSSSRQGLIGGLALIGFSETSYLTWSSITDNPVLCRGHSSCGNVLESAFAKLPFLDMPLSSLAVVAYGAVALLVFGKNNIIDSDSDVDTALLALTTAMATFSGYLMWVLFFVLKTSCYYCYASAGLSFLLAAIVRSESMVANATKSFVVSTTSFGVTMASAVFLFYTSSLVSAGEAQASTAPAYQAMMKEAAKATGTTKVKQINRVPAVKKVTSPRALKILERIQLAGGKMYGAYWCSHCYNQKNELGTDYSKYFEYVECDKEGENSKFSICRSKKIPGYPTWELYGEYYPGEKTLQELESLLTNLEEKHPTTSISITN